MEQFCAPHSGRKQLGDYIYHNLNDKKIYRQNKNSKIGRKNKTALWMVYKRSLTLAGHHTCEAFRINEKKNK